MELPQKLKTLYRHWPLHTLHAEKASSVYVFKDAALRAQIEAFIAERMSIWKKKHRGGSAPYTQDRILGSYRFCNILREFDRQTIEYHELLNPLRDDFPLWLLNMFYCRMVARPETVRGVGLLSFNERENTALYEHLMASARPRYGTPYVFPVSVIMRSETPTRELFITKYLPRIMNVVAKEIRSWSAESVAEGVPKVVTLFGYNLHFLWTEVLIDVAYQFPELIDLYAPFPVGPGSLPTMRRIDAKKEPSVLAAELSRVPLSIGLTYEGKPIRLSAENWEGVGCEFRKYTNLSTGKGRKRRFHSSTATSC